MTLLLLCIDELECIANYLNTDEKCTLLTTGCKLLITKLSNISTGICIFPYEKVEIEALSQDDDGFHVVTRNISCTTMTKSISLANALSKVRVRSGITRKVKSATYSLLPLYFRNARSVSLHDKHLQQALQTMQKIEFMHLYVNLESYYRLLSTAPSTLRTLIIVMNGKCQSNAILDCIPKTLQSLSIRYSGGGRVQTTPEIIKTLPKQLEYLAGININSDELVSVLPQSLTTLRCGELDNTSTPSFPPNITILSCIEVCVSTLTHLKLQELRCHVSSGSDSLLLLHSLTKLDVTIYADDYHDWTNPIQFPSSITDLTLCTPKPICCLIPASVKNLDVQSCHNIFELATSTWSLSSNEYVNAIPDGVIHAIIEADYADHSLFISIFEKLKDTVETLSIASKNLISTGYYFKNFIKCTKLVVPSCIIVRSLPRSLTHLKAPIIMPEANMIWPDTLRHLTTHNSITQLEISKMNLEYLECEGDHIIDNFEYIAHIPQVVLRMPKRYRTECPVLPPNIRYEFYKKHTF